MKVGYVGAGSLGTPLALATESRGHEVTVYDINPNIEKYFSGELPYPHQEEGVPDLLADTSIKVAHSIGEVVASSELVFAVVQTPHGPEYEGVTPLPESRSDFNYEYLKAAVAEVVREAAAQKKLTTLVVMSTCLPGTWRRDIAPLLNDYIRYVYNPCFPAMGNAIWDYLNAEFNLIGVDNPDAADFLEEFYGTINDSHCLRTDITTAEGIKVSYNTIITAKTVIGNCWGELSERLGMNFNDIKKAWDLSTRRLLSSKYLDAGVGDGGQCHPRDGIALSWLAQEVAMSHDLWSDLMTAREEHAAWHAEVAAEAAAEAGLPLVLLGTAFKPESNITTGSPATLIAEILRLSGERFLHVNDLYCLQPAVYFIATNNQRYQEYEFPPGSVVIDPFGAIPDREGVTVRRLGRK